MATNLEIAGAVKRTQKGAADWYYGGDNEAWPDMATALANIPASVRPGKTIGVFAGSTITEYWWPTEAVADNNLVPKTPDLSAYATTSYVDSALVSAIKLRGDWDISSGTYPSTGGTGTSRTIQEGNAWRINKAGTIGTQSFDIGDFIVALIDAPVQTPTNWAVLEHNDQQATETIAGTAKIASQTDIQNEFTTNDTDTVTPKKFWQGVSRYDAVNRNITGNRVFTGTTTLNGGATDIINTFGTIPENRLTTADSQYSRFVRRVDLSNNQLEGRNNLLQVGGIGKALQFSAASSQYVIVPATNLGGIGSSLSACIWFKTTQIGQGILQIGNTTPNKRMGVAITGSNQAFFYYQGGNIQSGTTSFQLNDGIWHHAAVTYNYDINGGTIKLYMDGNLIATNEAGDNYFLQPNETDILVGQANVDGSIHYFTGTLDQFVIYGKALTQAEVITIYNNRSGTVTLPSPADIVRRYDFEEGTGNFTADSNPNITKYTASLINGVSWNNIGIVPVSANSGESSFFKVIDGQTNGERGIAIWGDFNGRNQQQGRWFQFFQNITYPLVSNNTGQWLFNPNNSNPGLPVVASTVDIAGNLTIGADAAGDISAPANGLYVQGTAQFPSAEFTGYANAVGSTPEIRWTTDDTQYSRFLRRVDLSNNQFEARNNVLQVGGIGKALDFNSAEFQYGIIPTIGMATSGSLSFSLWFKTTSSAHNAMIQIGAANPTDRMQVGFGIEGSQCFYSGAGNSSQFFTNANIIDGKWHNLIVSVSISGNDAVINVYIDTTLQVSNSVYFGNTLDPTNANLTLGFGSSIITGSQGYFTGSLDQLLIYNRVLTTTDVNNIYNLGAATASPPSDNLIRRYEFEEGTGTITADINPNTKRYNATLYNDVAWNNIGIVPIMGTSSEASFFTVRDGLTNGERGIATWGDFNGRNQQQGRWFQFFQNLTYPLVSNNNGQWRFDPNNSSGLLPNVASTIDIAGNLTTGSDAAGIISAPENGIYSQGDIITASNLNIGNKLKIATGTNASIGTALLSNGTVTIITSSISADSIIIYCVKIANGTQGFLSQGTLTPGESFIINSSSLTDNSSINWWIIN